MSVLYKSLWPDNGKSLWRGAWMSIDSKRRSELKMQVVPVVRVTVAVTKHDDQREERV